MEQIVGEQIVGILVGIDVQENIHRIELLFQKLGQPTRHGNGRPVELLFQKLGQNFTNTIISSFILPCTPLLTLLPYANILPAAHVCLPYVPILLTYALTDYLLTYSQSSHLSFSHVP